jgi:hypothetical protein
MKVVDRFKWAMLRDLNLEKRIEHNNEALERFMVCRGVNVPHGLSLLPKKSIKPKRGVER